MVSVQFPELLAGKCTEVPLARSMPVRTWVRRALVVQTVGELRHRHLGAHLQQP